MAYRPKPRFYRVRKLDVGGNVVEEIRFRFQNVNALQMADLSPWVGLWSVNPGDKIEVNEITEAEAKDLTA